MLRIIEATLTQIARKQKSITKLFPDFFSNPIKVKGVIDKGGLRMDGIEGDTWKFQIHSGSEEGKWYEANVRWKNIVPNLQRLVADRRNWNRAKTKVDLRKIAAKLFKSSDIELSCDCPAQLYWGGDYILSQDKYRAKYGDPEGRPPVKRNPKEYGAHCKHLQVLMRALPFYKSTMANWLKKEQGDVIKAAEEQAAGEAEKYKAAGAALRNRRTKESLEEAGLSKLQAAMKKRWGAARGSDMMKTSTFPEEEQYVKFWLLSDGTLIHVPHMHATQLPGDEYQLGPFLATGAVRISSEPNGDLALDWHDTELVTDVQFSKIMDLARLHGSVRVVADREKGGGISQLRSPSDVPKFMRGEQPSKPSLAAQFHESVNEETLPPLQRKFLRYWKDRVLDEIEDHTVILNDGTLIGGGGVYHRDMISAINCTEGELIRSGAIIVSIEHVGSSGSSVLVLNGNGTVTSQQWEPIREGLSGNWISSVNIETRKEEQGFYIIDTAQLSTSSLLSFVYRVLQGKGSPQSRFFTAYESTKNS